ncbi:MAG: ATP-binding protein [Bacteroidia bacterium]
MSLRAKYLLYIGALHLLLGLAAWQWVKDHKLWLFAIEAGLALSLALGWGLLRQLMRPVGIVQEGMRLLREQDFQQHLRPVSSPEVAELIEVYNNLVEAIRQERHSLQTQHFFLDKLIDAAPSGILLLDYDDHLTYLNPAARQMLGVTTFVSGQPLSQLTHPLVASLQHLPTGSSQVITLHGNAQYKCQAAHFVHRGFPRRFLVVEELTRELLEHEKKAYGKVIRMMAHEVNNSVGAINSILASLRDMDAAASLQNHELIRSSLEIAIDRNRAMNQFMQNFARVIRVPAPQRQTVALDQLLRKTGTLLEPTATARDIRIVYDLASVSAAVDPDLMEQALLNMIHNAIDSIASGGEIRLSLRGHPGCIAVADNGPGIAPEAARYLFTPFFSTKPHGQGIGLTLIREIMSQHDMRYSLETRPDGWTVFEVQLP